MVHREEKEDRCVAGHKVKVNPYDISTEKASIHYPLPRLLAGLIQHLPKFNMSWDSPELSGERLPFVEYIEHPLRVKGVATSFSLPVTLLIA